MPVKITCMNQQEKLNPVGTYILAHHYKTHQSRKDGESKIVQPIYCLSSPRDIPLIMHCAKESGIKQYGIIVAVGGRHQVPIVFNDDTCFILESLGTKNAVGKSSVAQIAMGVSKYSNTTEIHTATAPRQVDGVSCGTDSFMTIKEALRNLRTEGDLFNFESKKNTYSSNYIIDQEELEDNYFVGHPVTLNEHAHQPKCVTKYIQSDTLLNMSPYRYEKFANALLGQETPASYSKRHHKIVSRETGGTTEVEMLDKLEKIKLKEVRLSVSNSAIADRREKHLFHFEQYAKSLTPDELNEIIYTYSGASLIESFAHTIPDELLPSEPALETPETPETNNIAEDFCAQETVRVRPDTKAAVLPIPEITLGAIADQAAHLSLSKGPSL